jgi:RimJ/RimL family protein N-acetyltransferase
MRAYFLTSARLGFGVWTLEDLPLALGLWGDPEVTRLTGGPFTPAQVSDGFQYWPIFVRETDEHVGCCGLQPRDEGSGVCELGFQLRRACWGQGLARDAAQVVIAHAFTQLSVRALYAGHHPSNGASRRLLESLGFRYTHDELYPPTGQIEPCYLLKKEQSGIN